MAVRGRTLVYVRANYHSTSAGNKNLKLEDYIRSAYIALSAAENRTFPLLGKIFSGVQFDDPKSKNSTIKSFSLRIATSVPGRNASLLPHAKKSSQVHTPQATPPVGNDFMDGDAHVHIQGDHVFYCASHLRVESIQAFFRMLFKKASLDNRSQFVNLEYVASNDITQQIRDEGVGAIGLNASMYKASTYNRKSNKKTEQILSSVASKVTSFFKDGNNIADANKMNGLSTKVEFSMDKRVLRGSSYNPLEIMSDDIINELAVANDLDSFYVRTLKGNVIRGSKFMIRKSVTLNEDGQTVDCIQAWNELIAFKAELAKNGKITL